MEKKRGGGGGEGNKLRGSGGDNDDAGDPQLFAEVVALLAELGDVVAIDESDFAVLTGISGVGPAYLALVAQKQVEAAVAEGMDETTAKQLVGSTLKGSSALLVARSNDSEQICREVATPGGVTEKGWVGCGFSSGMSLSMGTASSRMGCNGAPVTRSSMNSTAVLFATATPGMVRPLRLMSIKVMPGRSTSQMS